HRLHPQRRARRRRRDHVGRQCNDRRHLPHRLPARARRDPRGRDRRRVADGRQVLALRCVRRRPADRDPRQDRAVPGHLVLGHPGVQGHRHHRHLPAAVRAGARLVPAPQEDGQSPETGAPERGGVGMSLATVTPVSETPGPVDRIRRLITANPSVLPTVASVVIFVGMIVYGETAYGRIVQASTLSNLLINNTHLIVLAVALTFVIITGGIDLSVGSIIAFSSVAGVMLANAGWHPLLVIVAMIGFGALFGLVSGILIRYFNVQPFIATLAMMFLGRGLASLLSTKPERLPEESPIRWISEKIRIVDGPKVNDLTITPAVIIAVLVVLAAFFVLHRTRTGRTVYAIGGSESSALLMGLPVQRTKVLVYVISGALSGLAAVLYTSRLGTAQNITGIGWELDAIAAAVIGGTVLTGAYGYVLGSVVGALVLGLMNVLITR